MTHRTTMRRRLFLLLCFIGIYQLTLAQLCQGSLGDPLVNITFGAGPNPGLPLGEAKTSYQYIAADCPNDGSYTIRSKTDRCFTAWHTLNSDHTGDPDGYFMLINASTSPGIFYVDTVQLACSNTTYEFAAWVLNTIQPSGCGGNSNRPNLTFTIEQTDGTVLQTFSSGDIIPESSPTWRQIGFFFTTPSFVNKVVLKMRNNAPGGCGNDLALDDITFRPCGPKLTVAGNNGSSLINLCKGQSQQLTFSGSVSAGFDNPFLQWQRSSDDGGTWTNIAGANTTTLQQAFPATTPAGNYLFRLTAAKVENSTILACRVNSEPVVVKVNDEPTVSITGNSPLCEHATLSLQASGGTTYSWTAADGTTGSGSSFSVRDIQLSQAGRYAVTGVNPEGCAATASIDVLIHPAPQLSLDNTDFSICEGDTVQLAASGGQNYSWSPSAGLSSSSIADPLAFPSDSTLYLVVATNAIGCADSALVSVNVYKRPTANAGPDKEIGQGQRIQLSGSVAGTNITYVWSPPTAIDNVNSVQPFVSPTTDQTYRLTVTSTVGCGTSTDSVAVKVYKGLFVPTGFTPNRDGKNDVWRIFGLSIYPSYEVMVFNRYGQLVYRAKNTAVSWDGTFNGNLLPTGSYPFLIKLGQGQKPVKGLVTIVR